MEGRFLGFPTIAVSLVGDRLQHFDTAARVAVELVQRLERHSLPAEFIFNVNVPDRPYEELAGIRSVRLGFRHKSEPVVQEKDPHDRTIYWVGPAGGGQDAGEGTDFHAIDAGAVAITPLKVDLTRHEALQQVAGWLRDD
jgi:5'-nucleotidase